GHSEQMRRERFVGGAGRSYYASEAPNNKAALAINTIGSAKAHSPSAVTLRGKLRMIKSISEVIARRCAARGQTDCAVYRNESGPQWAEHVRANPGDLRSGARRGRETRAEQDACSTKRSQRRHPAFQWVAA